MIFSAEPVCAVTAWLRAFLHLKPAPGMAIMIYQSFTVIINSIRKNAGLRISHQSIQPMPVLGTFELDTLEFVKEVAV
jgi:hypothetical protein